LEDLRTLDYTFVPTGALDCVIDRKHLNSSAGSWNFERREQFPLSEKWRDKPTCASKTCRFREAKAQKSNEFRAL
jgi:hypothetical protein